MKRENQMAPAPEIWVIGDRRSERLFGFSLRVLGKARELAAALAAQTIAVLLGSDADGPVVISMAAAAAQAIAHGADRVLILTHSELAAPRADLEAAALADLARARAPRLLLFALSDHGRELASRAARLLDAGLIADGLDLRVADGEVVASCAAWGGEIVAEIAFVNGRIGLATVNPHGLKASATRGEPGTLERIPAEGLRAPANLRLLERAPEPAEHRKLEAAEIVVAGGAGLGSAEGFGLARELAAALGGEVGATRPAVLAHWCEEERLIGQTGKTVRPRLLFSIGTSGAVQYTAGIAEAGTIVAVNRDPDAPIFHFADFGVVADAKTFLPAFIARVRRALMRRLADLLVESAAAATKSAGFGAKMRELREAHGWTRERLAQATAQSPEFIAKVESDELTPAVSFLLGLARALGVDPSAFLREEEKAALRDQRSRAFVTRTQNYSYETLTPGAENEHLRAFLITIEPKQDHKPVAYKHEGEEFVYVLEGELELILAQKSSRLRPGESLHFNSDTPHQLKSLSEAMTRCLVILYTP